MTPRQQRALAALHSTVVAEQAKRGLAHAVPANRKPSDVNVHAEVLALDPDLESAWGVAARLILTDQA